MTYAGLDVHRRVCYGTMMDDEGRIVRQGRFSNDRRARRNLLTSV